LIQKYKKISSFALLICCNRLYLLVTEKIMRTITVDIINEKAFNLLKNLEVLQLIRLREDEKVTAQKNNLSKFKGALKKQPIEDIELQLKELRNAWE